MSRRISDKFFQEFHIDVSMSYDDIAPNQTVDWEFPITVPRPLKTPPAGTYWAIELHSITWANNWYWREDAFTGISWCITSAAKVGKTPFITFPGNPENIFFLTDEWLVGENHHPIARTQANQRMNHAKYTDDSGHGQLIIPETIYVQCRNIYWTQDDTLPDAPWFSASLQYTFVTVSCSEFLQELASQLK